MYCEDCGYKNKESAKYCKKCGANLEEVNDNISQDVEKILENEFEQGNDDLKLSKKELIEYLTMGKELEINKLGLENSITALNDLDNRKHKEIVKPYSKPTEPHKMKFNMDSKIELAKIPWKVKYLIPLYIGILIILGIIGDLFGKNIPFIDKFCHWIVDSNMRMALFPIVIISIFSLTVLLISFISGLILNKTVNQTKYNQNLKDFNKKCEDIDQKNKHQLIVYNEKKKIIDERIENVTNNLNDVKKTLSKYYDVNVIYPKYRNLIAITTFIEYLESGRCKSLYGYTGCYNVYEQELRQNTIIGKLDQVLIQLDQIKKVQYATFLAIEQSNAIQQSFVNTCNDMLEESKRANAMLEAQAQDTKIIKQNSEIVTTISALNYINHN